MNNIKTKILDHSILYIPMNYLQIIVNSILNCQNYSNPKFPLSIDLPPTHSFIYLAEFDKLDECTVLGLYITKYLNLLMLKVNSRPFLIKIYHDNIVEINHQDKSVIISDAKQKMLNKQRVISNFCD